MTPRPRNAPSAPIPTPSNTGSGWMHSTLCTIGFAGKSAGEFFRLLGEAGVKKVIDIRERRDGQLSGFAKFPDIAFFLDRIGGIAYAYEPALAPSPEIRRDYRQSKDWSAYESSFLELMRDRAVPDKLEPADFEGTVALLCSEPGPEKCHRRLVAEFLAQSWRLQGHTVEIRHLVSEMGAPRTPRKKKLAPGNDGSNHH
jgi:uncharacterized protein (DUF488 family)